MTLWTLLGRVLSLILGIAYDIVIVRTMLATYQTPAETALRSTEWCLLVLVPLALIWFPEPIGAATGYLGNGSETPAPFVAFMGWLFLIVIPLVVYLVHR